MNKPLEINISSNNRIVTISAPVKDSLQASQLSDRLNSLPSLKVFERNYDSQRAEIKCYIIKGVFTIEKLNEDLEKMSDLINDGNENK